jgi:hypothetical protein
MSHKTLPQKKIVKAKSKTVDKKFAMYKQGSMINEFKK